MFPPGHYLTGSSLKKVSVAPEPVLFYQEPWFTQPDWIPSQPCDLRQLRENFEASVL